MPPAARPQLVLVGALAVVLLLPGCAGLLPGGPGRPGPAGPEVRPGATADYDVLVAHEHLRAGRLSEARAAFERAVAKDDRSAYLHRQVAEGMARESRLGEALDHAERAFELEPEDDRTRLFLAQIYRLRHEPDEAERVLLDPSGAPFDERAAFLLYQTYLEAERVDDAVALAEGLAAADPDSIRAKVALATAYDRQGRAPEAERVLREAVELDPENLRLHGLLARSLRERDDRPAEIAVYRRILELHPHHHATLLALGDAQIASEDIEGAIATFEEIERRHPRDLRSIARLGFLFFEARRWPEARRRFESFVESAASPEYELVFFLGSAMRRGGDEEGAIRVFESVPPEHKNYSDARTELATIYERRGDYEAALAQVEAAIAASPSRTLDLYAATLRAKAGDFDGAVRHIEGLLDADPGNDELLYNLGVIYGEARLHDESIRYMELALEHNPENASALNYVGYTWAERGIRLDEAEDFIVRALELRPEDGYITDSLGWVYYMRARPLVESGRPQEAQQYLDRALRELERAEELTGGDPVIAEHLGDIHLLRGDRESALGKYEEAVSLEPRVSEQPQLFEKLEKLRGELH